MSASHAESPANGGSGSRPAAGTSRPTSTDGKSGSRPARRSRSERSADSRQLILDATLDCLFEQGYARTTTLTIQARAGVSRGRLLHHFPSRDELVVAACQHLATHHLAEMECWVARSPDLTASPMPERLDRATAALWLTFQQRYFWGAVELWTAARTEPGLRETLLPQERRLGAAIRRVIDVLYGTEITAHPRWQGVRELLFTSMRGVALTYAFDHRDPERDPHVPMWQEAARSLLLERST
jgi:AcrR family transcriptional regulator